SQVLAVSCSQLSASVLPSGENATPLTAEPAANDWTSLPVAASLTRTTPPWVPQATSLPSADQATHSTAPLCSMRTRTFPGSAGGLSGGAAGASANRLATTSSGAAAFNRVKSRDGRRGALRNGVEGRVVIVPARVGRGVVGV